MQYLISKSKINHIENIQKIHRKWQIILTKYEIMKKFVNSFMELHASRTKYFVAFIGIFLLYIKKKSISHLVKVITKCWKKYLRKINTIKKMTLRLLFRTLTNYLELKGSVLLTSKMKWQIFPFHRMGFPFHRTTLQCLWSLRNNWWIWRNNPRLLISKANKTATCWHGSRLSTRWNIVTVSTWRNKHTWNSQF